MPSKNRGRSGRQKASASEGSGKNSNTALYVCGVIGGMVVLGGGFVAYLAYQDSRKKQLENAENGKAQPTLSVEDLEKRIEEEGSKVMQQKLKKDNEGTKELRALVDRIDIDTETTACRLLLAQFMRWRLDTIEDLNKPVEIKKLHHLLNFDLSDEDDAVIGSWIKLKFDIAFGNKNMQELQKLRKQLETFEPPKKIEEISHTQYWQVLFKLACIFGDWEKVDQYGDKVAELNNVVPDPQTGKKVTVPILQAYANLSRREPSKYPNYYIYYLKSKMFKNRFDTLYQSHLQFLKWNILSAKTQFMEGSATDPKWQEVLDGKQNQGWKNLTVSKQDIWVFGSVCQLRLNAIEETQCILTGPWNDTEMLLVGSMIFSVQSAFLMRIDVTIKLERQDWQPKVAGKKKGGWLWAGRLVYDRLRWHEEKWRMICQELYETEMTLEEMI